MSWLSKLVNGRTLKLAAIAAAGYAGREYIFGNQIGSVYDTATGKYIEGGYSGGNFAAKTFNYLGVTPFSETKIGSFLQPLTSKYTPGLTLDPVGDAVAAGARALTAGERFDAMPTAGRIQASGVRSDTNFQAGQAGKFPIGNGGRVGNALGSEAMQQYLAKQVRMMGLPAASGLPTGSSVSTAGLASTTSAKRRQYKGLVS